MLKRERAILGVLVGAALISLFATVHTRGLVSHRKPTLLLRPNQLGSAAAKRARPAQFVTAPITTSKFYVSEDNLANNHASI